MKVFISYRRDDTRWQARAVYNALAKIVRNPKQNLFLDIDSTTFGRDFRKQVNEAVGQCDVLLALIGPGWLNARDAETSSRRLDNPGDFVRIEIASALARDIPVVPVLFEGAEMPQTRDLADDLKPLSHRHGLRIRADRFEGDMKVLIEGLQRSYGGGVTAPPVPLGVLAGIGGAALALALGWWAITGQGSGGAVEPFARTPITTTSLEPVTTPEPEPPLPDARRTPASTRAPVLASVSQRLADFALFRECEDCPDMVVIPGGSFSMGSPSGEAGRDEDEDDTAGTGGRPVPVTIPAKFAVARFEVTKGDYRAFIAATGRKKLGNCLADLDGDGAWAQEASADWTNPGFAQSDSHPAVCVSWDDAQAYVAWMNTRLGLTGRADRYRLMSEAEFEYANRAGTATAYPWGSADSQTGCGLANYADASAKRKFANWTTASCDDGYVYTAPVGRLSANGFGLYDMAGNVWEWVEDCYEGDYSSKPTDDTAFTKRSCLFRVFRGGSWGDSPQFLRSASRYRIPPDVRSHDLGFRLTRVLAD